MNKSEMLAIPTYDPNNLINTLITAMSLKNDRALSDALKVAPPVISKIRNRKLHVGPSILIRMHEESPYSIRQLKALAGI